MMKLIVNFYASALSSPDGVNGRYASTSVCTNECFHSILHTKLSRNFFFGTHQMSPKPLQNAADKVLSRTCPTIALYNLMVQFFSTWPRLESACFSMRDRVQAAPEKVSKWPAATANRRVHGVGAIRFNNVYGAGINCETFSQFYCVRTWCLWQRSMQLAKDILGMSFIRHAATTNSDHLHSFAVYGIEIAR